MRRFALLLGGILCGALAVRGQDDGRGDALAREIDRLEKLLRERIQKDTPAQEQQLVLKSYEVADLCTRFQDHPLPPDDLKPSGYETAEVEVPEPRGFFEMDALIELIRVGVAPESWEIEGASIEPKNGRLFVNTLPRVQGKIERMLAWCRSSMDRRVSVDVVVVPVAPADAALLSGALELTAEETQRLLPQALGAVTLAGWDGQILGSRAGRVLSYVHDYHVKIADGVAAGDPVTQEVFAGCSAEVRACLDEGQGAILHCRLEMSRIGEPLPVQETDHGNLELPRKDLTRVLASFWAPLGRTVVAGACTAGENPCAILVTVRRVRS